ncbi:MAG: hypothetical protein F6J96_00860 [Symploca sp. SIO1C2]|nr:hypothetical protein [Symploca sp. SIO1C2]
MSFVRKSFILITNDTGQVIFRRVDIPPILGRNELPAAFGEAFVTLKENFN